MGIASDKLDIISGRRQRISAMEKLLTDLNQSWEKEHLDAMTHVREKQNQIVLKNKIEQGAFKMKIDLTSEKKPGEVDKHTQVFLDSKKHWEIEAKKKPRTLSPKVEAEFKRNRGNQKLPSDLYKKLYGK